MLNKVDRLDNLEKLRNKLEKVKILNKKTCLDLYFFYIGFAYILAGKIPLADWE
jgi:hypothetical protein